ncbi:SDH family Clp fold serine proteinase [Achromobacter xylosoxidans]|nr:SppA protein [Achromobacter xylosoxidans]CUR82573.1 Serine dehydrogenase proteinase [Achromobacter xylosoxidans]
MTGEPIPSPAEGQAGEPRDNAEGQPAPHLHIAGPEDAAAPAPEPARDVIVYSGQINRAGYDQICLQLDEQKQKSRQALLVLTTPGGDPHAGFRIARALQHEFEEFHALIPWVCKSAGTLICIGATKLYLCDQSELGPLDVQIKKSDELVGRNSGLDILQAVNYLQNQAMNAFRTYVDQLTYEGLSTRAASDMASKLTTGLFSPIFGQIDPMRLAEMQRATDIAFAYGQRLNEKSRNLRSGGLEKLVVSYPSHGFVIDRKEARSIFIQVDKPAGMLLQWAQALYAAGRAQINAETPQVLYVPSAQGDGNANLPNPN